MSLQHEPVPLDGSINAIPGFLDYYVEHYPSHTFVKFPSIDDPTVATSISYKDFAQATHRIAYALRPDNVESYGETIAVLVHCDSLLYMALLVGMIRAGIVVCLLSDTNMIRSHIRPFQSRSLCHLEILQKPLFRCCKRQAVIE